jgi:hypothetical protein
MSSCTLPLENQSLYAAYRIVGSAPEVVEAELAFESSTFKSAAGIA